MQPGLPPAGSQPVSRWESFGMAVTCTPALPAPVPVRTAGVKDKAGVGGQNEPEIIIEAQIKQKKEAA